MNISYPGSESVKVFIDYTMSHRHLPRLFLFMALTKNKLLLSMLFLYLTYHILERTVVNCLLFTVSAVLRVPTHFQKLFYILFQYLFNTKLKDFNTII